MDLQGSDGDVYKLDNHQVWVKNDSNYKPIISSDKGDDDDSKEKQPTPGLKYADLGKNIIQA